MEQILVLLIGALIAESVWESIKMLWQEGKFSIDKVGAMVVSLVLCFSANINLLTAVGLVVNPVVGIILTGILLSRGSSFLHELITKVGSINKPIK